MTHFVDTQFSAAELAALGTPCTMLAIFVGLIATYGPRAALQEVLS